MRVEDTIVIKLGGSLLTDKSTPYKLKDNILRAVAEEIKECIELNLIKSLVIVHGVGSYGHPPVIKYNLHKGFKNKDQLIAMSKTQQIVNEFRTKVATAFLEVGVPVNLMHASSMVVGNKMTIFNYSFNSLIGFLSLGMVPLIGGDMMYDKVMGFSVCSGDQIAVMLSRELQAKTLIFATDVLGVFNIDPKLEKEAELFKEISINEVEQLVKRMNDVTKDASGRMRGKLSTISMTKNQIKDGFEVAILSMNEKGILKKYLTGEETKLTKIIFD